MGGPPGPRRSLILGYLTSKWLYGYSLPLRVVEAAGVARRGLLVVVGSGLGHTPMLAARRFGCRALGLELFRELVDASRARAARRGLTGLVGFRLLSEVGLGPGADLFFFETVLWVLRSPGRVLRALARRGSRVAVLELAWPSDPRPGLQGLVREALGPLGVVRGVGEWRGVLEEAGFSVTGCGAEGLGLAKKFVDDVRADAAEAVAGLAKTLYRAWVSSEAARQVVRFVRLLRRGGLVCSYYIAEAR